MDPTDIGLFRLAERRLAWVDRRQQVLAQNPHSGALFAFRGKRGHLVKLLWWDGQGLVLHAKRLERGRFTWPATADGVAVLTPAQLSMLLEGVDWRHPIRSSQPTLAW